MITIHLVNINGVLMGRSFSDGWNLETLMKEAGIKEMSYKTQTGLKKLRKLYKVFFTFAVRANDALEEMTALEKDAMEGFNQDAIAA
jgi:hypothetical protein